jgi:hypothetical protein
MRSAAPFSIREDADSQGAAPPSRDFATFTASAARCSTRAASFATRSARSSSSTCDREARAAPGSTIAGEDLTRAGVIVGNAARRARPDGRMTARAEGVAAGIAGTPGWGGSCSSRSTSQDLAEAFLDFLGERAQEPADRLRQGDVAALLPEPGEAAEGDGPVVGILGDSAGLKSSEKILPGLLPLSLLLGHPPELVVNTRNQTSLTLLGHFSQPLKGHLHPHPAAGSLEKGGCIVLIVADAQE